MNEVINVNRFCRLFLKHSVEHYKSYAMSLAVLVGVMILGGGFMVYLVDLPLDQNAQLGFFVIIMLLSGTLFTSTIFADLGDRRKAAGWLTLPASHLEKFLVAWIYSFLVFIVIYTISFYVIVLFAVNVRHFPGHSTTLFNLFDRQVFEMYALYAFLHSITICGAVWFEKLHFVKTAFVFFIAIGVLVFINKVVLGILIARPVDATPPFGDMRISDSSNNAIYINVYSTIKELSFVSIIMFFAILFWIAAYFRIKEKQV